MKSIVLLLAFAAVAVSEEIIAVVKLLPHEDTNPVSGNLQIVIKYGSVIISGSITGLTPGQHGIHIHEKGDLSNNCLSTGGHFNPTNQTHGALTDTVRHVGDLGNIRARDNGYADVYLYTRDNMISLVGPNNIIGRSVVVHSNVDDLGKGGNEESLINGNTGSPVSCGVIGLKSISSGSSISIGHHTVLVPLILFVFKYYN
ncbi:uncharacterized protein LOC130671567 [Microplitis mediator]|uniref:uncharacterized protein LOC130671567 n=1 Tax=Microplitis mediator TaxID=375433 RepID=UPI002555E887|nr:uncharacterized protein LOC130671567 [Microplitis mediator]